MWLTVLYNLQNWHFTLVPLFHLYLHLFFTSNFSIWYNIIYYSVLCSPNFSLLLIHRPSSDRFNSIRTVPVMAQRLLWRVKPTDHQPRWIWRYDEPPFPPCHQSENAHFIFLNKLSYWCATMLRFGFPLCPSSLDRQSTIHAHFCRYYRWQPHHACMHLHPSHFCFPSPMPTGPLESHSTDMAYQKEHRLSVATVRCRMVQCTTVVRAVPSVQ